MATTKNVHELSTAANELVDAIDTHLQNGAANPVISEQAKSIATGLDALATRAKNKSTLLKVGIGALYLGMLAAMIFGIKRYWQDAAVGPPVVHVDSLRAERVRFAPEDLVSDGWALEQGRRDTSSAAMNKEMRAALDSSFTANERGSLLSYDSTSGARLSSLLINGLNRLLHGPPLPARFPALRTGLGQSAKAIWNDGKPGSDNVRLNWVVLHDLLPNALVPSEYFQRARASASELESVAEIKRNAESTREIRLIWLVLIFGALGGLLHGMTSFVAHVGADRFESSWFAWYLMRPVTGLLLAAVFYCVVRGGVMTQGATTSDVNLFATVGIAGLVGIFSKAAMNRLQMVFEKFGAANPDKPAPAPTLADVKIEPATSGQTNYVVSAVGTNITKETVLVVGTTAATTTAQTTTSIKGSITFPTATAPNTTLTLFLRTTIGGQTLKSESKSITLP